MDVALCEGWIVADDMSEPFLQLGMPAAAVRIHPLTVFTHQLFAATDMSVPAARHAGGRGDGLIFTH